MKTLWNNLKKGWWWVAAAVVAIGAGLLVLLKLRAGGQGKTVRAMVEADEWADTEKKKVKAEAAKKLETIDKADQVAVHEIKKKLAIDLVTIKQDKKVRPLQDQLDAFDAEADALEKELDKDLGES